MRVQKPKKIKRSALEKTRTVLGEKIRESAVSVLPILVIVVILCLCIVPMRTDLLLTFLIGALLLTVGMGLFSLGAEQSMTLIGRQPYRYGAHENEKSAAHSRRIVSSRLCHHRCRARSSGARRYGAAH